MNIISSKKPNEKSILVRNKGSYSLSFMYNDNNEKVFYIHKKGYSQIPVFGSFTKDQKVANKKLYEYRCN